MLSKLKIEEFLDNKRINSYELLFKEGAEVVRKEIEEAIKGKKENEVVELKIPKAYGERKAELVVLIPLRVLKQNRINPVPGLVINVDGMEGIIKTVNGGRVIVDFNHPLAEKDILFKIKIVKTFEKEEDFVEELLKELLKNEKFEFDKGNKKVYVEKEQLIPLIEELFKIYKLEDYKVEKLGEKENKEGEERKVVKENKEKKESKEKKE
jgi:FKBP-type peptidyl-prolyl cis-trans isomerase 2